jgi:hypothetical protein
VQTQLRLAFAPAAATKKFRRKRGKQLRVLDSGHRYELQRLRCAE